MPGDALKNGISATSCADAVFAAHKIDAPTKHTAADLTACFIMNGV